MAHVSAAERRPQLIKAAIDLMTREGVAAGSTRAIAAELGVAQATVHYTFGTKEDLYRAVMDQITEDLIARVEQAAPENAGFEETVAALAGALWRTMSEPATHHQLLFELSMFALRTPGLSEARQGHYRQVIDVTAKLITETAARTGYELAEPAGTVARFFLAGFDGLTMQRLCLPDETAASVGLKALVAATVALAGGRLDLAGTAPD
ncbi:TetR/AcrR family transcriptional regulator [Streptomyces sp. ISL-22]|uniref:TetR/AcrR family transcriptional regulator n=1 Tax=unclassified Streptomyces TaxID=2593676 RepID=UPI001BEB1155|nr:MULTISPECIES: TetR/AcrR family transcriptional regulator [unclassified Streptomyces]MBT2423768.1 TetR/AcrR family transcriptional regulator [Streptomyces sp. ISL-24]MBT2433488.1 TetR/AcrR family transcriptional regulator [Streptomyces sp. ISL-22]